MVKFQREEIGTRLKRSDYRRVNYFKLNQGYDFEDQDSEYFEDQDSYKVYKKIRKEKVKEKKERLGFDNLEVLLQWKKDIKISAYETDRKKIHLVKKIVGADLAQFGKEVQGLLINVPFRKDFKQLDISKKMMPNGIVFIWSDKSLINEMLEYFESKGFVYIENLVVVQLSQQKALTELNKTMVIEQTEEAVLDNLGVLKQVKDIIHNLKSNSESIILNQAKKVLMMFRRFDTQKTQLELRHQRTPDVLFDLSDGTDKSQKSKEYIYQMIETLLPKSQLMELFADSQKARKRWISICQQ